MNLPSSSPTTLMPSLTPVDARALSAQALQHIPACSSFQPADQPLLILASLPFHVVSYTPPEHDNPTQVADVQLFCERFRDSMPVTSQAQCYEALKVCVEDRNGLFHRQPPGRTFHPLTKAQVITELYSISWYIYYVLCRTQPPPQPHHLPISPATPTPHASQDELNKSELARFVQFIQLCVHETPRTMLARPDGSMDLWRLSQLQTRSGPCGIDESLIACWCGMDFYVKWYRCAQLAQLINYETFRVTRMSSTSIFASVLCEMAEDEEELE